MLPCNSARDILVGLVSLGGVVLMTTVMKNSIAHGINGIANVFRKGQRSIEVTEFNSSLLCLELMNCVEKRLVSVENKTRDLELQLKLHIAASATMNNVHDIVQSGHRTHQTL